MENKPKRSKAFIITFIIVIALLLVGYYMLKNRDTSSTKSSTGLSKIFEPLLGTPKEKTVTTVEKTDTNSGNTIPINTNPNDNTSTGSIDPSGLTTGLDIKNGDGLGSDGLGSGDLSLSNLKPLPSPKSSSTSKPIKNKPTLATDTKKDGIEVTPSSDVKESLCPVDDPLSSYFTDQEKKDLDNYLRQFYLIAPTIRTADDIIIAENEILENTSFGGKDGQLEQLIGDCNDQKIDPSYTGPQIVKSNPWYQGPSANESATYLPNYKPGSTTHGRTSIMGRIYELNDPTKQSFSLFEKLLYIW